MRKILYKPPFFRREKCDIEKLLAKDPLAEVVEPRYESRISVTRGHTLVPLYYLP